MVKGFSNVDDFTPVIGWELYQVTLDKYVVMFWFEQGHALLNIFHSFSYRSADGDFGYTFEVYGRAKRLELDRILRVPVVAVEAVDRHRLVLRFANGDELVIHDSSEMRSWSFVRWESDQLPSAGPRVLWGIDDWESDESGASAGGSANAVLRSLGLELEQEETAPSEARRWKLPSRLGLVVKPPKG